MFYMYLNAKGQVCFDYTAASQALPRSKKGAIMELLSDMSRKAGCKCNRNAQEMHDLLLSLLDGLTLKKELIPAVQYELENFYHEITRDSLQQEDILKGQLSEINKKIEAAEESLLLKQVTMDVYSKFNNRYLAERNNCKSCCFQTELSMIAKSGHFEPI